MTPLEHIFLVEDVEEGRVSKDDPRYVALVKEERQRMAERLNEILSRIRNHQFGTNREVAAYYHSSLEHMRYWKHRAHRLRQMSKAEWDGHLQATQAKRKRVARKHDSTI